MRIAILVVVAFSLAACSVGIDEAFEKADEFSVEVFESGISVRTYQIKKGSDRYQAFAKWARANRWNWNPTPATFMPGVIVRGGGFVFNFVGDTVVVNNLDGQYYKEIEAREYAFFY